MWYVVSAGWSEQNQCVTLKLYNPETSEIRDWFDDSGFSPYLLSDAIPDELAGRAFGVIKKTEVVKRFDALKNCDVYLTKVSAIHPEYVGGQIEKPEILKYSIPRETGKQTWEDDIPTFLSYIYDNDIAVGMPHAINGNKLQVIVNEDAEKRVNMLTELTGNTVDKNWVRILEYPAPYFKRISLDIEVLNEGNRIPNAELALQPIICICMVDDKGIKYALVLEQYKDLVKDLPEDVQIIYFFHEIELLIYCFKIMKSYPFVITFNGDDFDLKYLKHRAVNLEVDEKNIPIERYRKTLFVKHGIHIDLYKFFFIKSIQIYSFQGKYKNVDLDTIGKALLNKGKLLGEKKWVGDMSTDELVKYCMRDAEITMELTTFNHNLVMNLILVLSRISRLPIENVSRESISKWIKSYMYYDHRRKNYLIPKSEDILKVKGTVATKALIKGKKYKGATVIDPQGGIWFNTDVDDFGSLYPSIFKIWNLGYQTINCNHEECKSNVVPNTPHWVCTKYKALESIFVGSVRDLRLKWYKGRAKDKSISKDEQAWYSAVEQSLKVIMNASYGVFGAENFVLYCPPVAESVTAYGRSSIMRAVDKAQSMGIKIIYGDTDSIFLYKPTEEQLKELKEWAEKELNMELDVEKHYRFICLSGRKKNYVGVKDDGEVDVKGMTGKKKHSPIIIKTAFENCKIVLKEIHTEEEFNEGKSNIKKIVLDLYSTIKRRKWTDIEDLAFHYNLGKEITKYGKKAESGDMKGIPQHVKAALILQESGQEVVAGQVISFVKTIEKRKGMPNVKPVELAKNEDVNIDKYIEFIRSTFSQLLEPLNIDFDEVIGIKKLSSFF